VARFKADLSASGMTPLLQRELSARADAYAALFREYVTTQDRISAARAGYVSAAHAAEPLLEKLSLSAADDVAATRERVQGITHITTLTVGVAIISSLLLGLGVAMLVSRRIARAVAECLAFATGVAAGDFTTRIVPRDRGEFGTLAFALNEMTQGLEDSRVELETRAAELAASNRALQIEVGVRQQTETELRRLVRARKMMSDCNHVLVHAISEATLLADMCRTVVEAGGYRMAWVGYAEHDEYKTVRPVAQFGFDGGLEAMPRLLGRISWADTALGRGAVGTAIRTGAPCVRRDFPSNPDLAPWREEAARRGYVSVVTFPLYIGRRTIGALAIYAAESDAFNEAEIDLLAELATDVGFGIEAQRMAGERQAAQDALREREAGLHRAQQMSRIGHVITGPDGAVESWSEMITTLLGVDAGGVPQSTRAWLEIVHPDDRAAFRAHAIEAAKTGARMDFEYRLRRVDGSWVEVRQVMEPIEAPSGARGRQRWFNTIQDITAQRQAESRIRRLNRVYAVLSGINTLIVRARVREELFREACRIAVELGRFDVAWIGVVDREHNSLTLGALCGGAPTLSETLPSYEWLGAEVPGQSTVVSQVVREGRAVFANDIDADPGARYPAGQYAPETCSLAVLPLMGADAVAAVLCLHAGEVGFFDEEEQRLLLELAGDISFALDHIGKLERLDYLAFYDALTELPNSTLFHDRLRQFLQGTKPGAAPVAVILVDLDRFTQINDTFGRHAGDILLQQVAQRFRAELREPYSLARVSADTFAVAVPGLRRGADAATIFDQRLLKSLAAPVIVDGRQIRISARAGIALHPEDGHDAETLFKNAEAALKRAQSSGERFLYYAPAINARINETLTLEGRLRDAVEREQFVLHYQPKIDSRSGRIAGLEALIRWNDPDTGLVAPGRFIPLLETSGLILEVGQWALRQALLDHRRWQQGGLNPPRISVNVSSVQFRRQDLAEVVRAILEQTGAEAGALELEITESLIMESIEANTLMLKKIRDVGITIALDDFGTGYSSLGYLATLPLDALKIDRGFVSSMVTEPDSMAIVSTIVSLAHALGLGVVAEGVETAEQAGALARLACDEMQGYLFSRPVPAEEIAGLLRAGRHWASELAGANRETRSLLVLDDDANFLSLLERELRADGYPLLLTGNPQQALELLARHDVGVVLCDQRMPGMNGAEFLGKVRAMYPHTVRIMCSGYPDFEAAQAAINVGAVYKFVGKSASLAELRAVLREAFTVPEPVRAGARPGSGRRSARAVADEARRP
jgi:diguanylate cyclase (GGDEF)-like protein/PAS domain S-box-containing protein